MTKYSELCIRFAGSKTTRRKLVSNIVVMRRIKRPRGRYFEKIGFVGFMGKTKACFVRVDRLATWVAKGAKLSPSVKQVLGVLFSKIDLTPASKKGVFRF